MKYVTPPVLFWHFLRTLSILVAFYFVAESTPYNLTRFVHLCQSMEFALMAQQWAIDAFLLLLICLTYMSMSLLLDNIICIAFNLTRQRSSDTYMLLEKEGAPLNSAFIFEFERSTFTYEKFKKWTKNEFFEKIPGTKVKLIHMIGHFFWQPMDDREFNDKFEEVITKVSGVHTKEQLQDYINKVYFEHMNLYDNCPWRFHVVEDYDKTSSYVLMMFQHSVMDGVSMMSNLKLISDCPKVETIPRIRGLSKQNMFMAYLLFPYLFWKMTFTNLLTLQKRKNSLMNYSKQVKQEQKCFLANSFDQEKFNKSRKMFGCTFGQAICAIIGQATKEYMMRHGDKDDVNFIRIAQTVSLLPTPQIKEEMRSGCNVILNPFTIPAERNLQKAIKLTKQDYKRLSGTYDLETIYLSLQSFMAFSWHFVYHIFPALYECFQDLLLSTVPGPTDGFVFEGMQTRSLGTVLTPSNAYFQQSGFTVCSTNNRIRVSFTQFVDYIDQPQELMDIMVDKMNEFIEISAKKQG